MRERNKKRGDHFDFVLEIESSSSFHLSVYLLLLTSLLLPHPSGHLRDIPLIWPSVLSEECSIRYHAAPGIRAGITLAPAEDELSGSTPQLSSTETLPERFERWALKAEDFSLCDTRFVFIHADERETSEQ